MDGLTYNKILEVLKKHNLQPDIPIICATNEELITITRMSIGSNRYFQIERLVPFKASTIWYYMEDGTVLKGNLTYYAYRPIKIKEESI